MTAINGATFYRAQYVSRHFEFEAYGATESDAHNAMLQTLKAHARQCGGLGRAWFAPDDIYTYPVKLGAGCRDKEPLA